MHRAAVVGSCIALFAELALAAPGDALMVTGDLVNVRAGPGMEYCVRLQVHRNQPAMELARKGAWVRVELTDLAAEGWIHRSRLHVVSRAQPAAAPTPGEQALPPMRMSQSATEAPPAESTDERAALTRFRSSVNTLNERALAAAGVELFAGVELPDDGTVRVLVTEAWNMVPEAGQRSYTDVLFGHWQAVASVLAKPDLVIADGGKGLEVADSPEPLRLQVIDPSGRVVSEKSGLNLLNQNRAWPQAGARDYR
jgi:hypothetical protein